MNDEDEAPYVIVPSEMPEAKNCRIFIGAQEIKGIGNFTCKWFEENEPMPFQEAGAEKIEFDGDFDFLREAMSLGGINGTVTIHDDLEQLPSKPEPKPLEPIELNLRRRFHLEE
jgi:hypothetical protein